MTANLETMVKFRDLQVAEDFAKAAELGYMDKEFTVYGVAYFEENQRWYFVSDKWNYIDDFVVAKERDGRLITPIMVSITTCQVPFGEDEKVKQNLKRELAIKLQKNYPEHFFLTLNEWGNKPNTDEASALLKGLWEKVSICYDYDQLQCYENLLDLAYTGKVLTITQYQIFVRALKDVYEQMIDDVVITDMFEKTFYGVAYFFYTEKQIRWYIDAKKQQVKRRKEELEQQGAIVSPLFIKNYGYNYVYKLADARNDFAIELQQKMGEAYMNLVDMIMQMPTKIERDTFLKEIETLKNDGNILAAQMMQLYGYRWHIR